MRDLARRLRALEARLTKRRHHDLRHLTDRQLLLIEGSVAADGDWDRDYLGRLAPDGKKELLAAFRSISASAYRQLGELFGINLSLAAQDRDKALTTKVSGRERN